VRYADGDTVREQKALVTGKQARLELTDARSCPAWVMPNAHGTGYYRFALAPRLQQSLSGAFAKLDEREQRVYADSVTAAYGAGALSPSQLLAALPQFASADVRQTVTAGMYSTDWMAERLLDGDVARTQFRADVAAIYRPRLQQLGLAPKAGEADDNALLRNSLAGFFAETLKDKAVRDDNVVELKHGEPLIFGKNKDRGIRMAGPYRPEVVQLGNGVTEADLLVHDVRIAPDTRLGRLLETPTIRVNSMHHQGIKRLAEGLRPNAYAPDGLIEGVESPNGHFLLGVQWHPEALAERDPAMRKLFAAFVEEAAR